MTFCVTLCVLKLIGNVIKGNSLLIFFIDQFCLPCNLATYMYNINNIFCIHVHVQGMSKADNFDLPCKLATFKINIIGPV